MPLSCWEISALLRSRPLNMRFKRERRGLSEHPKCAATLYTVGLTMESSLYSYYSETTMFSFEKNIKMFFSTEIFSLPSKQELLLFCSTATTSLYRRGHQPMAPTTTQSGPSACRIIPGMLKVISCCVKVLMSVLSLQFLPSANFSFPTTAPKLDRIF